MIKARRSGIVFAEKSSKEARRIDIVVPGDSRAKGKKLKRLKVPDVERRKPQ